MPAGAPPSTGPTRRVVTGAALLGGILGLTGCGVRLEEDAPELPLVPRRAKVPGEAALLALVGSTLALAREAASLTQEPAPTLAGLHTTQALTVADALRRGGVPERVVAAAEDAADTSSTAPPSTTSLAAAERRAVEAVRDLQTVDLSLAPTVLSLMGQRLAAASLLDPTGPAPGSVIPFDPTSTSTSEHAPATLGPVLEVAHSARRLFDVVVVRSPKESSPTSQRSRAVATTAWLDRLVGRWGDGLQGVARELPVSVVLPFPVTSPEDAARLAEHTMTGLRAAYGRHLATLDARSLAPAWAYVPDELADIELQTHAWGGALQAFPGLT